MADQGDNKDVLLDKLDSLMKSGRAKKQLDPPPLLTDAIPNASESTIPTLTDAVETPEETPQAHQKGSPVNLRDVISSRLLAGVDREMAELSKELPAHGGRLAVLHRSIRFALPELVRLRWEESPDTDRDPGTDADGLSEPEQ